MATLRLYTAIYVALLVLAASKWGFFQLFDYWTAVGLTFVTAVMKIVLIAAYFQHLRWEPRSVSAVAASAVFAVLLLTIAASFSIT